MSQTGKNKLLIDHLDLEQGLNPLFLHQKVLAPDLESHFCQVCLCMSPPDTQDNLESLREELLHQKHTFSLIYEFLGLFLGDISIMSARVLDP